MNLPGQLDRTSERTWNIGKRVCQMYRFTLLAMLLWAGGSAHADSVPGSVSKNITADAPGFGRANIAQLPKIRTSSMNINYRIFTPDGQVPVRVELWYARGWEGTLQLYDYDEDRASPMTFVAPGEGVYRLLIVAVDRWGQRSYNALHQTGHPTEPPSSSATAQQVVLVDYTAPRLYLQHPQGNIPEYRDKQLTIRWVGFDSHLDAQPVRLYCQRQGSEHWVPISGPLPARDEFIWKIPEPLEGPVIIKAVITDQAGNQEEQMSGVIRICNDFSFSNATDWSIHADPPRPIHKKISVDPNDSTTNIPNSNAFTSLDREKKAKQCFQRGNLYSQRLEWEQAANAFRKVLEYDPKIVSARVNLANALFRMGKLQQAQTEYVRCLQGNHQQESALFGLAQTQIRMQQYDKAQQTLANLLEQDHRDWQAWLMHGNVSAQLGQRQAAVTSWQQASNDMSPVRKLAMDQLLRVSQDN